MIERKTLKRKRLNLSLNRVKRRKINEVETPLKLSKTPNPRPSRFQRLLSSIKKRRQILARAKRRRPRIKRTLFKEENHVTAAVSEARDLLPNVFHVLNKENYLDDFMSLLRLIGQEVFPMHNIAFILLLEVAKWFSLTKTSAMKYRKETMLFFHVGLKLFHGSFIRFMSGGKSEGHLVSGGEADMMDPKSSKINFAVPSIQLVRNYKPSETLATIPSEVEPGVIEQALALPETDTESSYILSFDGKKISPGFSQNAGDEDLWGHEKPNLKYRRDKLKDDLNLVDEVQASDSKGEHKIDMLFSLIMCLSLWIKRLRELLVTLHFNLTKLMKWAGVDWRKSKYLFAISSVQAKQYQSRTCTVSLLRVVTQLLDSLYKERDCTRHRRVELTTTLSGRDDVFLLQDPDHTPRPIYPPECKQRTEEWHHIRKTFRLTGSTIFNALGLSLLKDQQEHIDTFVRGIAPPAISEEVKERMQYGTDNEKHAVGTLVSTILPAILPELRYHEEGSYIIKGRNEQPLILVSPDGSLRTDPLSHPVMAVEIKCPFPADFKTPVQYSLPKRYVTQVLAEMAALDVDKLLFLSWSKQSTTVFLVKFNCELWESIRDEAEEVYGPQNVIKPTRFRNWSKETKKLISDFTESSVTFLMEVPSVTVTDDSNQTENTLEVAEVRKVNVDPDLDTTLAEMRTVLNESFELNRKQAVEVIVWLLSDSDRLWKPELPHSLPVAYGLKGYSAPVETLRKMCNEVLDACYHRHIHVACTCFDGQYLPLATSTADGKPLTLIQLQRYVWMKIQEMSKEDLLDFIASTFVNDGVCEPSQGVVTLSSCMLGRLLKICREPFEYKEQEVQMEEAVVDFGYNPIRVEEIGETEVDDDDANQVLSDDVAANPLPITNQVLDLPPILDQLQNCPKNNVKKKWDNMTFAEGMSKLRALLASGESLMKMIKPELDIVVDHTVSQQARFGMQIKKSWNKREKVNSLCTTLGIPRLPDEEKMINGPPPTLKESCLRILRSSKSSTAKLKRVKYANKKHLALVAATLSYPSAYDSWLQEAPFAHDLKVVGVDGPDFWFCYPEYHRGRNQLEPKCLDSHHLLVNCRVKVCSTGFPGYRIDSKAWKDVAEKNPGILSRALVFDLLDKQSNAFARRTFSEDVETAMKNLGHPNEAAFCKLIREWYSADDDKGIPAIKRIQYRFNLRKFLMTPLDFGVFPPLGQHVNGMSKQMLEGFLQSIDTKCQLYAIVKSGTMNVRSVTSLNNETFFGDMTDMEPTKLGCPKAIVIPRIMSTVTELMHLRHNPSLRTFRMRTARNPVYPRRTVETPDEMLLTVKSKHGEPGEPGVRLLKEPASCAVEDEGLDERGSIVEIDRPKNFINEIVPKDHFFDSIKRARTKTRKSKVDNVSRPGAPSRGSKTIRSLYYKTDETSLLDTTRLGIDLQ